jgi:hypothetical protein
VYSEDKLRDELIGSEQAQTEFLKWKLVLVAGAGSAALGLNSALRLPFALYILCLIPFVCTYVDLVYTHLMLRILVIGTFLRKTEEKPQEGGLVSYETFVERARCPLFHPFALESLALHASTVLLSVLVFIIGLYVKEISVQALVEETISLNRAPFLISGGLGLFLTVVVVLVLRQQVRAISGISEKA